MLRHFLAVACLLFIVGLANAGEAGHIVFVAGDARVAGEAVVLGSVVNEGDELITGEDGYLYLKTIDNGFFILRPNGKARVVNYHVDTANAVNTRIKLELVSGVARSISGQAVKQARQNFRFNTPVAAIGVRGTDFTVFTNQETSRVAVISGGVVVSGFAGACGPDGGGPCEGASSRELFAGQSGQLLQVGRGQVVPQLLQGGALSPDTIAPPRTDEPGAKASGTIGAVHAAVASDVSLDAQKGSNILAIGAAVDKAPVVVDPVPPLPPQPPPAPPPPALPPPPAPSPKIMWGRWQPMLDQAANIALTNSTAQSRLIVVNGYFAIYRQDGVGWQAPMSGQVGFALKESEAYVFNELNNKLSRFQLENARLVVDFSKATFTTGFDMLNQAERFKFQAQGSVSKEGLLFGASQFASPTNMLVNGVLSPENGGRATYLFQGRIDDKRQAIGITNWQK